MTTPPLPIARARLITPEGRTIPLLPQDYQIVVQALTTARRRSQAARVAALRALVRETCGKYARGMALTDLLLQERTTERAREEHKYQFWSAFRG